MPQKRSRADDPSDAHLPARKRQRAQRSQSAPLPSPSSSPSQPLESPQCPVPLTRSNLHLWEQLSSGVSRASMAPPSASEGWSRKSVDGEAKLEAHNIYVNQKRALPADLDLHIKNTIRRARETTPSASRIAEKAPRAAATGEQAAIDLIAPDILFRGTADGGSEALITSLPKLNLHPKYLPLADAVVVEDTGSLSQAQPDTAIGYVRCRDASRAKVEAPLTPEQERTIIKDPLTALLHFPFLTAQWKGYTGSEGHYHASLQGARDSTCIVNSLYELYESTRHIPSTVDTCHFSVTSNMDTAKLWVHWRENKDNAAPQHYMECIHQAFLEPIEDTMAILESFRKRLRNILDYATGPRLVSIRHAIDALQKKKETETATRVPSVPSSSSSKARSRGASQSSDRRRQAHMPPPSPPASQSAPQRKRARTEDLDDVERQ